MKKFREFDENCINSTAFRRYYRWDICGKIGKCDRCPWHGGENRNPNRPKTNKYKNKNRNTIREFDYEKNV